MSQLLEESACIELAAHAVGMDPDADDFSEDAMHDALLNKLGVDFDDFRKVASALALFAVVSRSGLTGKLRCGFVKGDAYIVKMDLT